MPNNAASPPTSALARQAARLDGYRFGLRLAELGKVAAVGDGIAWIEGLPSAAMDEIVRFDDGSEALVFHLGSRRIGAILLRQSERFTAGTTAYLTDRRLTIGVGDACLGRVLDPLGRALDGGPPPRTDTRRPLEAASPPIIGSAKTGLAIMTPSDPLISPSGPLSTLLTNACCSFVIAS